MCIILWHVESIDCRERLGKLSRNTTKCTAKCGECYMQSGGVPRATVVTINFHHYKPCRAPPRPFTCMQHKLQIYK